MDWMMVFSVLAAAGSVGSLWLAGYAVWSGLRQQSEEEELKPLFLLIGGLLLLPAVLFAYYTRVEAWIMVMVVAGFATIIWTLRRVLDDC